MHTSKASLEEVFLELTADNASGAEGEEIDSDNTLYAAEEETNPDNASYAAEEENDRSVCDFSIPPNAVPVFKLPLHFCKDTQKNVSLIDGGRSFPSDILLS